MLISAIIVTRGNVDLGPCLSSIDADEVIIRRGHFGVWERWRAAAMATHEVVYTQDDDAVVDFPAVIREYERGKVTCNMPMDRRSAYPDGIALVGWGCVFDRSAVNEAFAPYLRTQPLDDLYFREADRVFTGLSYCKLIDVPFTHLPHAWGNDRMGREDGHGEKLRAIRARIYAVRAGLKKTA